MHNCNTMSIWQWPLADSNVFALVSWSLNVEWWTVNCCIYVVKLIVLRTDQFIIFCQWSIWGCADFKGAFHQRRSSLNQVQIWPWPSFSSKFCCSNAVQIKSRVKLGLTMNRRGRRIKLIVGSTRVMQRPMHRDPCHLCPDWWQFGIKCICVGLLHPVSGYPSLNNYFNSLLGLL